MLYYFASNANHNIIAEAVKEAEQVVVGSECNQELQLLPYIKDRYADFSSIDKVIVDIAGIKDTDADCTYSDTDQCTGNNDSCAFKCRYPIPDFLGE